MDSLHNDDKLSLIIPNKENGTKGEEDGNTS